MASMSGFPEFLPEGRVVEARAVDILRSVFELHGFAGIATRALEPLDELSRKGDITKEVYVVRRLHATESEPDALGLHFDLTVPFARYVREHAGHLAFPFRRYQIQPAWRGERPQEGRYREFWQADIDIVGDGVLAGHHDAEVVAVMLAACARLRDELGLPPVLVRLNNRKLVQGFYGTLGVADPLAAIQITDKLAKIGADGVTAGLAAQGIAPEAIGRILAFASVHTTGDLAAALVAVGITVADGPMAEGLAEVTALHEALRADFPGAVMIDCAIARGLDYYTGSVFEMELVGSESLGTICAGGRYDSLARDGNRTFPGVGISFGLTRVFAPLITQGVLVASRAVPSAVLVAVDTPETRGQAEAVARALRARGVPTEVSPDAPKYGRQIRYADRRGIPYVWFGGLSGEVKDIRTGDQAAADATTWLPPAADLVPTIGPGPAGAPAARW